MKVKILLSALVLGTSLLLFSFKNDTTSDYTATTTEDVIDIPKNIQEIISNKCMGCHSDETKSGKSKMKMNFDKLSNGEYSRGKVISKLDKIVKTLGKDKMPPEKFLAKYPDKKLTPEESKSLTDWASEQSSMMKGE